MMASLHFLDWAIITTYFLFILWVGIFKFKKSLKTNNEFILSGRKLSLVLVENEVQSHEIMT